MANQGTNPDAGVKAATPKPVEQQIAEFRSSYDKRDAEKNKTIETLTATLEEFKAKLGQQELEKEFATIGILDEPTKQARLKALQDTVAVNKREKELAARAAAVEEKERMLSAKELANEYIAADDLAKLSSVVEMKAAAAEAKLKGIEAKLAEKTGTKPDAKLNLGGGTSPTRGETNYQDKLRSGITELMKSQGVK